MPGADLFLTVGEFFQEKQEEFELILIAGKEGLDNEIREIDSFRPGLPLSGYTDHFRYNCIQILGNTEISFLDQLSQRKRSENLHRLFKYKMPCIIVARDLEPPKILKMLCNRFKVPLLKSTHHTPMLFHQITIYLMSRLAPSMTVHGTLVDIYGAGVLIQGKSGIGKSETALDLIDRGHRLVADDAVKIYRKGEHILMGTGIAPDSALQYHMEVRGVGILDIAKIYGIRAVRLHKRVEIVLDLINWEQDMDVERIGIKEEGKEFLGIDIPYVKVPLVPGKNISVIAEVTALNFLLKISGYDTAKMFNATLIKLMQEKAKKLARLDEDEE